MPESINQLRPISYCNFLYKVITKVMVSRLKPLTNSLVTPKQIAFVGNRLIQDNLVVAHEAFHFLKQRSGSKGRGLAVKIDMNKAYDRVEWPFLEATLLKLGFDPTWVSRVMILVSTVSYSYQVNGFQTRKIRPKRGLRQGGPHLPLPPL